MLTVLFAALALQGPPADTAGPDSLQDARVDAASAALIADAYLDPGARALVEGARARRQTVDRSIAAYRALARERLTVGMRAGFLERIAYRRETAARVSWARGAPAVIEFLGAREAAPAARPGVEVPEDLDGDLLDEMMANLAFDPAEEAQLLNWGDSALIHHPLAPGSEAHYRFRSGDTTLVRLPDRTLRVIELQILPRRSSLLVIRGSFWVDAGSFAVVRTAFQLSRDVNTGSWAARRWERTRPDSTGALVVDTVVSVGVGIEQLSGEEVEGDSGEFSDAAVSDDGWRRLPVPFHTRLMARAMPDMEARLRFVTVEYGLWEDEWWLPRLVAAEGMVRALGATLPLRYERRYDDYRLDTAPSPEELARRMAGATRIEGGDSLLILVPDDTASLLASEHLPPSIFSDGPWLLDPAEREAVLGALATVGKGGPESSEPWRLSGPVAVDPLVRYNRVEGLSLGLSAETDLGPLDVAVGARLGTADLAPRGFLSAAREGANSRLELTGYRALATLGPHPLAFSWFSSAAAFLFAYDEPDYHDVMGASLSIAPPASAVQRYEARVYAQREEPVGVGTELSVPQLFDETRHFRPNPAADPALQYGGELALRWAWGTNPTGFRLAAEVRAAGAFGDFAWAGPEATLRVTLPLPGPLVGSLETEVGTVWGDPGFQHLRRVGGSPSLRGYDSGAMAGTTSWRARGELATAFPLFRFGLFSDAGWAGRRTDFASGSPLISVGVGLTLLDGFARLDVGRAVVAPEGWRVGLYLDRF